MSKKSEKNVYLCSTFFSGVVAYEKIYVIE